MFNTSTSLLQDFIFELQVGFLSVSLSRFLRVFHLLVLAPSPLVSFKLMASFSVIALTPLYVRLLFESFFL